MARVRWSALLAAGSRHNQSSLRWNPMNQSYQTCAGCNSTAETSCCKSERPKSLASMKTVSLTSRVGLGGLMSRYSRQLTIKRTNDYPRHRFRLRAEEKSAINNLITRRQPVTELPNLTGASAGPVSKEGRKAKRSARKGRQTAGNRASLWTRKSGAEVASSHLLQGGGKNWVNSAPEYSDRQEKSRGTLDVGARSCEAIHVATAAGTVTLLLSLRAGSVEASSKQSLPSAGLSRAGLFYSANKQITNPDE